MQNVAKFPSLRDSLKSRWRSPLWRDLALFLLAGLGFGITASLEKLTGQYFSSLTLIMILTLSLWASRSTAVLMAISLSLLSDYFYIPPIGSVLDSVPLIEQAVVLTLVGVVMSIIGTTIRANIQTLKRTQLNLEQASQSTQSALQQLEKANEKLEDNVRERTVTLKAALEEAEGRERAFRTLADSMPHVVWVADPTGQIEFYNHQWQKQFKERAPLLLESGLEKFIHPDDRAGFLREWKRVLQTAEEFEADEFEYEVRILDSDRQAYRWYLARANSFRSTSGEVTQWFGTLTNVDELKSLSSELAKTKDLFHLILDNIPDSVVVRRFDGSIQIANRKGEEIAERLRAGVVNTVSTELDVVDFKRVTESRKTVRSERSLQVDGATHVVLSTSFPLMDTDGAVQFVCTIETDITEQRAAAEEKQRLELAQKSAEENSRLKSDFLTKMSHEIRTPLNGILGMLALLSDTELSLKQASFVRSLHKSSVILFSLINDILDLSKIEAGRLELELVDFSLIELMEDVHESFRHLFDSKNLEFVVSRSTPSRGIETDILNGDPSRIRQILNNLLANALKFTSAGKVALNVAMKEVGEDRLELAFSVSDSGIGISLDGQSRLFKPFVQENASTSRQFGGTGLGLAICKDLANLMGGDISVASRPGEGAVFSFAINVRKCQNGSFSSIPIESNELTTMTPVRRGRYRVLVAEDNIINQEITESILRTAGYESLACANGREAVEMVRLTGVDAILMDCHMPEMDGYEATRELRSQGFRSPIIALTANAFTEDRDRCLQAGMNSYLSKPIKPGKLIQALDTLFSERSQADTESGNVRETGSDLDPSELQVIDYKMIDRLKAIDKKGSRQLIHRLVQMYLASIGNGLDQLRAGVNENASDISLRAHALKSSHANLGAQRVVAILEGIEDGSIIDFSAALLKLEVEVDAFCEALKQLDDMELSNEMVNGG